MRRHEPDDCAPPVTHGECGHAVEGGGHVGHVAVNLVDHRLARAQRRFLALDVYLPKMSGVEVLGTPSDDGRVVRQVHQLQGAAVLEVDIALYVLNGDARFGQGLCELHENPQVVPACRKKGFPPPCSFPWRQRRQIVANEVGSVCQVLFHCTYCTPSALQNASVKACILHKLNRDLQEKSDPLW